MLDPVELELERPDRAMARAYAAEVGAVPGCLRIGMMTQTPNNATPLHPDTQHAAINVKYFIRTGASLVQDETGATWQVGGKQLRIGAASALAVQGDTVEVIGWHIVVGR